MDTVPILNDVVTTIIVLSIFYLPSMRPSFGCSCVTGGLYMCAASDVFTVDFRQLRSSVVTHWTCLFSLLVLIGHLIIIIILHGSCREVYWRKERGREKERSEREGEGERDNGKWKVSMSSVLSLMQVGSLPNDTLHVCVSPDIHIQCAIARWLTAATKLIRSRAIHWSITDLPLPHSAHTQYWFNTSTKL